MANCCCPSVLPRKCRVITRPASVFNSVQWLNTAPLMDSTSSPAGSKKLRRKMPARVMSTVAFAASTMRSSPSESVSWVSTRTSGSTADAFREAPDFASAYRKARRTVSPGICAWRNCATAPGKSSRLIGENASAFTVSSWTSLPVATPSRPICPEALSTDTSPIDCSTGSGPVATCERIRSANGRDCGGLRFTRSFRVSGSNRHNDTIAGLAFKASPVAGSTPPVVADGSRTSVTVAPPGTSKISSLNSPWAGLSAA